MPRQKAEDLIDSNATPLARAHDDASALTSWALMLCSVLDCSVIELYACWMTSTIRLDMDWEDMSC